MRVARDIYIRSMRAVRDIYSQMILFLFALSIIAAPAFGMPAATNVLAAVLAAFVLDAGIDYYRSRKFEMPTSGIISGFFVGLIVPFSAVFAVTGAALAILSKHAIRHEKRHLFNPAAFGIVASSLLLGFGTSWLAATSPVLILFGIVIVYGIRRWWTALSFLAAYGLLGIAAGLATSGTMPQLRPLYNLTLLFFALFMLIEPRTSPHQKKAMLVFGALVALGAVLIPFIVPTDPLLAALLAGNLLTGALNRRLG